MDFNHYFTNDEIQDALQEWAKTYPDLVSLTTLGVSYEKRPIWLVTLTSRKTGPAEEKPAMWIDANIHATELLGSTTAMLAICNLLTGYGSDPRITRLLDTCTFYIVPRLNPDGAALGMAANPRFVRSGVRYYPFEDKQEGLHAQDIDGDGRILQMRIQDPNGDWKVSSLDPRLLEKRRPDEHGGVYYRLMSEGLLEDYDGYLVKSARAPEGLDFNRNFPFQWRSEGEQSGAGPYPASEPEIKAVADFVTKHLNINCAITFHTFGGLILRPYSTKSDDEIETDDLWVYKKIGEIGTAINGYKNISTFHDFKYHPKEVTYGAFDDWMYDHFGAFTFTIELWDLPTTAGIKDRKPIEWFRDHPHEQDQQILQWIDQNAGDGSFIPWQPFDHPQLGKVELGGWNLMYTWRNAPQAFAGAEAAKQFPFILSMADMLPHVKIHTCKVASLGGGDYCLNLVIENDGFFSTSTSVQGKKRQATRPVRVELELPEGVTLVSGKRRSELGHLEGRSNKLEVATTWSSGDTDNRARLEWVLHAPQGGTVKVNVLSERAGSIHQEVKL